MRTTEPVDTSSDVLDLEGAAKLLKVCTETVRKLAKSGKLRGRQLCGPSSPWRFLRRDLLAFVGGEERHVDPAA